MTLIQLRRGTTIEWATADPVLAAGEPGWDEDTGELRVGDGVTAWSGLVTVADLGGEVQLSTITAANQLLIGTAAGTAGVLDVPASRFVGRKATGGLGVLTGAEAKTLLAIASGDVSGLGNLATVTTLPVCLGIACSDETTAITTGTAKATFRWPFAFTLTAARATLTAASTSGVPAFDVNQGGSSIFSTTLTVDANDNTSTTAATAAAISTTAMTDDAEVTVDFDTAGTGTKGVKLWFIGTRTA